MAVNKFEVLTTDFTTRLTEVLDTPIKLLFLALLGLWVVISGYKLVMRPSALPDILHEFLFIVIASALMFGQGASGMISKVYLAALDIMGGASEAVFSISKASPATAVGETGMARLVSAIENVVLKDIWQITKSILASGTALNPVNWFYAGLFILPFFLMMVMYFAQVIVAMFRVLLVAIFAPFLLMTFAFNWGRPMAVAGLKTMLSSIMVLFAATAAVSVILYGMQGVVPDAKEGDAIKDFASLGNSGFVLAIIMGWLGTALMTEGVAVANSITGSMLSNTAAGIITAGLGGSAAAVAGAAKGRAANILAPAKGHAVTALEKSMPRVAEMVRTYKSGRRGGFGDPSS